jgi:hypothetical protein
MDFGFFAMVTMWVHQRPLIAYLQMSNYFLWQDSGPGCYIMSTLNYVVKLETQVFSATSMTT